MRNGLFCSLKVSLLALWPPYEAKKHSRTPIKPIKDFIGVCNYLSVFVDG